MARTYNTRQKRLVLDTLMEFGAKAVTADEIADRLDKMNEHVGRATVYRQLDRLMEQGKARSLPGPDGTLFQYVADVSACRHHLHCQCVECGRLFHVECNFLEEISGHLLSEHKFALNPEQTILQGVCEGCREEEEHGAADT